MHEIRQAMQPVHARVLGGDACGPRIELYPDRAHAPECDRPERQYARARADIGNGDTSCRLCIGFKKLANSDPAASAAVDRRSAGKRFNGESVGRRNCGIRISVDV